MLNLLLPECNEDHLSCSAEHGEDTSGCVQCQQARQTPTDKLTYDETDMVLNKENTKPSSLPDIDQPNSSESSRISGCGIKIILSN